jgi:hypothetical protein
LRQRILISSAIGFFATLCCWFLLTRLHQGAADFQWAMRAAEHMLAGENPYHNWWEQYPLTGAVFALPFLPLPQEWAAALFYGISSGLLAFGVTREGWTRLLVFLAFPFWAGMLAVQWSTLITAAAFFPLLLPVTMAKPQVGLPVALTHMSKRGALACVALLALTFIVMPRWPFLWLRQWGNYEHFIPLFMVPGPLLLLALFRYKDKDAWLLVLAAIMPQRWFFDAFTLWLIPKTRRELIFAGGISWFAGIWRWYVQPTSFRQVGLWAVLFLYLPMLGILLWRSLEERRTLRAEGT